MSQRDPLWLELKRFLILNLIAIAIEIGLLLGIYFIIQSQINVIR